MLLGCEIGNKFTGSESTRSHLDETGNVYTIFVQKPAWKTMAQGHKIEG
jgi:hypothetical protein